jgi:hypothetical protein
MIKHCAIAATFIATLACVGVSDGLAAKKMTYEDAYTKCKGELAGKLPAETANSGARYTIAGGCMKKYGYRLKK